MVKMRQAELPKPCTAQRDGWSGLCRARCDLQSVNLLSTLIYSASMNHAENRMRQTGSATQAMCTAQRDGWSGLCRARCDLQSVNLLSTLIYSASMNHAENRMRQTGSATQAMYCTKGWVVSTYKECSKGKQTLLKGYARGKEVFSRNLHHQSPQPEIYINHYHISKLERYPEQRDCIPGHQSREIY
ncbi:hypothetical protein J6590_012451 [Homalodisca vitripennis]|nr:hypothetical protein J6590_012451 [Homalodisca vitripennis]